LVLDAGNLRIERFLTATLLPTALEPIMLRIAPNDFCVLDGRIFLLADHNGDAVHEIDRRGLIARSFGQMRNEGRPQMSHVDSNGYMLCDADSGLVVYAVLQRPLVRAFEVSGSMRWQVEIPGYHAMLITAGENGAIRFAAPAGGGQADLTTGLTLTRPGRAIVQIGVATAPREFTAIRSFDLDLVSGSILPITDAMGTILFAGEQSLVVGENVDFPMVRVIRWVR
jgi:hypothetical protein